MNGCSFLWHSLIIGICVCLLFIGVVCISVSAFSFATSFDWDDSHFDFISVDPPVQIRMDPVFFTCIIRQYDPSVNATLELINPTGGVSCYQMNWSDNGKFIFNISCSALGKYHYVIHLSNADGIIEKSTEDSFWVALSKDDRDSDGMPDRWEKKFGLNASSGLDAGFDEDNDGFSNRMEYEIGLNPIINQWYQNNIYRLKENANYFVLSFLFFLIISLCALQGMRRSSTWL